MKFMEIKAEKLYLPTTYAKFILRQVSKTMLSISLEKIVFTTATSTLKSNNNNKLSSFISVSQSENKRPLMLPRINVFAI